MAILVASIRRVRDELSQAESPLRTGELTSDGQQLQVFFFVAPDGLCYYFHEP